MAPPLLPIVLILGAGVGVFALAATAKGGNDKPVIKDGIKYGPMCGTIEVVDIVTFTKKLDARLKSIDQLVKPDMPAKEALRVIAKTIFPGPGCQWSTDGSWNCTFIVNGEGDGSWSELLMLVGDRSLGQAIQEGIFSSLPNFSVDLQGASVLASSSPMRILSLPFQ